MRGSGKSKKAAPCAAPVRISVPDRYLFSKCLRFFSVKLCYFSGTPLSGKIACTGHAASHAWQSMHSSGWM